MSPLQQEILDFLATRAATAAQLARELNKNAGSIRSALTPLKDNGLIVSDRASGREAIWRRTK